jgi:DUF1009 family protein
VIITEEEIMADTMEERSPEERSPTEELTEQITDGVDQASSEIQRLDREFRALVKNRPILALVGAVVTGYLVGRVLTRR